MHKRLTLLFYICVTILIVSNTSTDAQILVDASNTHLAAVAYRIGDTDLVYADMDSTYPYFEMCMLAPNNSNSWDVYLNYWGLIRPNYRNVNQQDYSYIIEGYTHSATNNTGALDSINERTAFNITKDYGDAGAGNNTVLNSLYDCSYYTNANGDRYTYIRISRVQMNHRLHNPNNDTYQSQTILDETYDNADFTNGTNMLIGETYNSSSSLYEKTPYAVWMGKPVIVFGIHQPKSFRFNGVNNKYGINFLGLTCPDQIRVTFFRTNDTARQIQDITENTDYVQLTSLTQTITPTTYANGVISVYASPADTFIYDTITPLSGTPVAAGQEKWGHVYRLEYNFNGQWVYGTTKPFDPLIALTDTGSELYFSNQQARFLGNVN
jgi:hypothetical protein